MFMKRFAFTVFSVLSIAILLISCSTVAFTGRKRMLLFDNSEITALSDQSYTELMGTSALSTDVVRASMVADVGRRLTSALEVYFANTGQSGLLQGIKWEYKLVRSNEVNAFCMPNGKIVFYEGIMPYCNTPDYVAVVMGHEIAHAIARHGNERMSQQVMLNTAGVLASEYIGYKSSPEIQSLFNLAYSVGSEYGVLLPYSRKHELEADEIGLILMAIAGYDVDKAPVFWQRMQSGSSQSMPEMFSTHPSDAKRIAHIQQQIPKAKAFANQLKNTNTGTIRK